MKGFTVDRFKEIIIRDEEKTLQKTNVITCMELIVQNDGLTDSEKISILKNLITAWEEVKH